MDGGQPATLEANVYVWLGDRDDFGHASMELPDGTYISWWPGEYDKADPEPCQAITTASLNTDMKPDKQGKMWDKNHVVPMTSASANKVMQWWNNYKEGDYNLKTNNCCHKVIQALKAGDVDITPQVMAARPYEVHVALDRHLLYKR